MSSKGSVAPFQLGNETKPRSRFGRYVAAALLLAGSAVWTLSQFDAPVEYLHSAKAAAGLVHISLEDRCPQSSPLIPAGNKETWDDIRDLVGSDNFKTKAIDWLAGAVKIPTQSYDGMAAPGADARWEIFGEFHAYLAEAFPLVYKSLSVKKVNTYGLLFEWTGKDTSLKPILLAGHQDVVPVHPNTVKEWTHPPFSGHFDGTSIWGRGSADDKCGLVGILITVESLLEKGFQPTRSVVLSFGFDEEVSGPQGAQELAKELKASYGEDAFALIVDEGSGYVDTYGTPLATPGIGEKGYIDTRVEIAAPGGHSSVPPPHTSIGMLAALLVEMENNPFELKLNKDDILYGTIQCAAAYGKSVPEELKDAIEWSLYSQKGMHALEKIIFQDKLMSSLVGTTQAIDLINGGVKTNALPEQAFAIVNHRVSTLSNVDAVKARDTNVLKHLAQKFNLTYTAFDELISTGAPEKTLVLSEAFGHSLEPAPLTPTSGAESAAYKLLSGTIKATYNAHHGVDGDNSIAVAPGMMTGNTDTRYYWDLSPHIFRYNHQGSFGKLDKDGKIAGGIHTVNEHIKVDSFLEMILFFTTLILNADEADL
ncbi:carboxypeptidase S [Cylindrobasidium torrendii FP15055 ss-10]|uniref:Carboxypeptidase S n=1 Tax=Cylindrobasidium torrendii FP15055 ss-10 TaxID=1314674 RepID=A0A0D7BAY8_9AGAR|nr:carboxypeptidase S [Cylindrobasidium torrendii FP15055 ss-10]